MHVARTGVFRFLWHIKRHALIIYLGVLAVYCHLRRQLIESYALLTHAMVACQRCPLPATVTVSVTRLQAGRRHLLVDIT